MTYDPLLDESTATGTPEVSQEKPEGMQYRLQDLFNQAAKQGHTGDDTVMTYAYANSDQDIRDFMDEAAKKRGVPSFAATTPELRADMKRKAAQFISGTAKVTEEPNPGLLTQDVQTSTAPGLKDAVGREILINAPGMIAGGPIGRVGAKALGAVLPEAMTSAVGRVVANNPTVGKVLNSMAPEVQNMLGFAGTAAPMQAAVDYSQGQPQNYPEMAARTGAAVVPSMIRSPLAAALQKMLPTAAAHPVLTEAMAGAAAQLPVEAAMGNLSSAGGIPSSLLNMALGAGAGAAHQMTSPGAFRMPGVPTPVTPTVVTTALQEVGLQDYFTPREVAAMTDASHPDHAKAMQALTDLKRADHPLAAKISQFYDRLNRVGQGFMDESASARTMEGADTRGRLQGAAQEAAESKMAEASPQLAPVPQDQLLELNKVLPGQEQELRAAAQARVKFAENSGDAQVREAVARATKMEDEARRAAVEDAKGAATGKTRTQVGERALGLMNDREESLYNAAAPKYQEWNRKVQEMQDRRGTISLTPMDAKEMIQGTPERPGMAMLYQELQPILRNTAGEAPGLVARLISKVAPLAAERAGVEGLDIYQKAAVNVGDFARIRPELAAAARATTLNPRLRWAMSRMINLYDDLFNNMIKSSAAEGLDLSALSTDDIRPLWRNLWDYRRATRPFRVQDPEILGGALIRNPNQPGEDPRAVRVLGKQLGEPPITQTEAGEVRSNEVLSRATPLDDPIAMYKQLYKKGAPKSTLDTLEQSIISLEGSKAEGAGNVAAAKASARDAIERAKAEMNTVPKAPEDLLGAIVPSLKTSPTGAAAQIQASESAFNQVGKLRPELQPTLERGMAQAVGNQAMAEKRLPDGTTRRYIDLDKAQKIIQSNTTLANSKVGKIYEGLATGDTTYLDAGDVPVPHAGNELKKSAQQIALHEVDTLSTLAQQLEEAGSLEDVLKPALDRTDPVRAGHTIDQWQSVVEKSNMPDALKKKTINRIGEAAYSWLAGDEQQVGKFDEGRFLSKWESVAPQAKERLIRSDIGAKSEAMYTLYRHFFPAFAATVDKAADPLVAGIRRTASMTSFGQHALSMFAPKALGPMSLPGAAVSYIGIKFGLNHKLTGPFATPYGGNQTVADAIARAAGVSKEAVQAAYNEALKMHKTQLQSDEGGLLSD